MTVSRNRALALLLFVLLSAAGLWTLNHRRSAAADAGPAPGAAKPVTGGMAGMAGMQMNDSGAIQLTAGRIREFGITFGVAEERTLEAEVRTVGTVRVDESRMTQVAPRFGGFVERLYVNETGQSVRRGQPLMAVYSPELVAAEQELLIAAGVERGLRQSDDSGTRMRPDDLVAAARRRLALWDISGAQVDAILQSGHVSRTLTLYAPSAGVVLEKQVIQGQAFRSGDPLYTIADLGVVWIDAELREADAVAVRVGSTATIDIASFPGQPITGRVSYIYPTLDAAARTVRARIEVPNAGGRLKPGMYATVVLTTPVRRALTVPSSAVLNTGDRALVFAAMGGGRLMPVAVVTGPASGDYTTIVSGIAAGQRVVTSAQYLLDSESNLAEVMKSMVGQMSGMDGKGADMKGMR